jgi:hypothetical protein
MGAWDIQHDRDAAGRSTRQTLVPSETERLRAVNSQLFRALVHMTFAYQDERSMYPEAFAAAEAAIEEAKAQGVAP